eukprot:jgi/Botrbrau1/23680/Bobra.55_2s0061.1
MSNVVWSRGETGVCDAGNCLVATTVCGVMMSDCHATLRERLQIVDAGEPQGSAVVRARCALAEIAGEVGLERVADLAVPNTALIDSAPVTYLERVVVTVLGCPYENNKDLAGVVSGTRYDPLGVDGPWVLVLLLGTVVLPGVGLWTSKV